jgi:transposase
VDGVRSFQIEAFHNWQAGELTMLDTDRVGPSAIRTDLGAIFISLELSAKRWLVTSLSPGQDEKLCRHKIEGGDLAALLALIEALQRKALEQRGACYEVISIQEAGMDGFWIHWALQAAGVESWVVDPASVAVNRRRRRAKTDRIDGEGLIRALLAHKRGEPRACSMVRPPSPEVEDARRLSRERGTLISERTGHANRITGLLKTQGIAGYQPLLKRHRLERLEALATGDGRPLPAHMKAQIRRELDRLALAEAQLARVEAERDARLAAETAHAKVAPAGAAPAEAGPAEVPSTKAASTKVPSGASDTPPVPGARLMQLKGVGPESASVLGAEVFWRSFDNRRQVGGYSGLTGSPFQSGQMDREQGISKAGNKRVRHILVELAWSWLRHQPDSQLARWFHAKVGPRPTATRRKVAIVALARKLLIALWRYETQGVVPEGALLDQAA